MRRACKLTLKYVSAGKRVKINALLQAYRAAVNFYIKSLWENPGVLDKATLARLPAENTRLSERFKSNALKQAIETVVGTRRSARELRVTATCPVFKGSAVLDAKFVSVEAGRGSFDTVLRLSVLAKKGCRKGQKIVLPTKATCVLNKWLAQPLAKLVQGCALSENQLVVWVELPDLEPKTEGLDLGIDQGMTNALATSDGELLGTDFKSVRNKVRRKVPGSQAKARACRERDNYLRELVNKLPWASMRTIAIEDLKNLKRGKRKNRGKKFRKSAASWTYCRVIEAIQQKAQQYRVRVVLVPPAWTSQECPQCGMTNKLNRQGEDFKCINCGHHDRADVVGARNVLRRALELAGSLESPVLVKTRARKRRVCFG